MLCDSPHVSVAAELHNLTSSKPVPLSLSVSPLGECQSTARGLFQSAVSARWVPVRRLVAFFLSHTVLLSGLKRLPLVSL